ncbi:hypothetical protein H4S08_002997 [Coemansia sp. RSA 1365]|nr:hypothetical protein H4S08_002997 [Coemansia sp. RSA 1365]
MASISSIISYDSAADTSRVSAASDSAYIRMTSTTSFPRPEDIVGGSRGISPSTTFATSPSCRSSPAVDSPALSSSSLASVLPTAADAAAAAAASALSDANRRRKVLTSRPPNSFILYRSDKLRELVKLYPELKQTQISKMCAENWKQEHAEVKEFYRTKQQQAKELFLSEQALEVERISGGSSDKTIIKRIQPTNTFIRYRTEMKKKLASQFAAMNQKDVSRACGLMWRSEPEHVKMRYRQSYNKEKRDFERLCSSSALEEQPSQEALSALASVIAEASNTNKQTALQSLNAEKKRRMSEGCCSAPVSPPQPEMKEHVRSKRLRSFHMPSCCDTADASPTASPPSVSGSQAAISLPSCASLLSLAGTSSIPASLPAHNPPMSAFHKQQPEQLHHTYPDPYFAHHGHPDASLPPLPQRAQAPTHLYLPPPGHYQTIPRSHYRVQH